MPSVVRPSPYRAATRRCPLSPSIASLSRADAAKAAPAEPAYAACLRALAAAPHGRQSHLHAEPSIELAPPSTNPRICLLSSQRSSRARPSPPRLAGTPPQRYSTAAGRRPPWSRRHRPPPRAPRPPTGKIDEPREGRDIRTEHEDDVWWTYPEEAKNQEYMLGPEYSPSECHLTNTDLVLIPGIEANQDSHQWARCDVLMCS
ncbi:translation initiation factor IF-2-like [Panicum virgatum]|uniref:translation initiation factor IF-2-like n=1 Tax=Panicum virgatum TaxID=38727 RepID=UPI0019D50E42|nr:translation initiation factor IF-2-like [Panicum virgatum]